MAGYETERGPGVNSDLEQQDLRLEQRRIGALILFCLVLFFFRLGGHFLWDIDEGMHAATAKNMVVTGDWITPTFNGEVFFDKTPLSNWFSALAFLVLGFTEFAARLPAALLSLAGVLVTYLFGRRMFGGRIAFLSSVALATALEYVILSRAVVHDPALAFFVTLSLLAFYRAYTDEAGRVKYLVLMYASAGVGVLAKGPLGVILPMGVIGLFLALRWDPGFLRKMMIVRGALIALAVCAPWYVLVAMRNETFLEYFFLKQNLGNFGSSLARHAHPWHFYLPVLFGILLPWSLHLPLALFRWFRDRKQLGPEWLFVMLWFSFMLLFFSAASSKLATYLLPLFPAVAFLVGGLWDRLLEKPDRQLRRGMLLTHLLSVLIGFAAIYYLWGPVRANPEIGPKLPGWIVPSVTAIILSGIALTSFFVLRKHYRALFGTLAGAIVVAIVFFALTVAPGLNPYKSSKVISMELDLLLPPGEKITTWHWVKDSGNFYTGRESVVLRNEEELLEHLGRAGALCLIDEKRLLEMGNVAEIQRSSRVVRRHGNKLILQGLGGEH